MKPLVKKTLEIAQSRIGVREIGRSNRGVEVDRFNELAGVGVGNPWCAGLTYANKHDAAEELGVENPFIRTAYTPDIFNFAKERNILVRGDRGWPEPGDDFLVMGPVRVYHTGHVFDVHRDSWESIEGNSNSVGSREGYEVAHNTGKPFAERFWWVKWSVLCADAIDAKMPTRALFLGGHKVADLPVAENVSMVPVRKWCTWMKQTLAWRSGSDTPLVINGKPLECEIAFYDSAAYVPVRELVALDNTLLVRFDADKQAVYVERVLK